MCCRIGFWQPFFYAREEIAAMCCSHVIEVKRLQEEQEIDIRETHQSLLH